MRKRQIFAKYPDRLFKDVKYFTIFIGHDRSGHSAVRAVLDAQPHIVLSRELNAPYQLKKYEFDKKKVFKLIVQNAKDIEGQKILNYDYRVPGQCQGKFRRLEVIGDKHAEKTTLYLDKHPELVSELLKRFGSSLKIINVVRNPYDNISAYVARRGINVEDAISRYFKLLPSWLS